MKRMLKSIVILLLLVFGLSACAKTQAETPIPLVVKEPPQTVIQPTEISPVVAAFDGAALLETRCTVCHALSRITSKTGTYDEWKAVVARMLSKGAQLTADEEAFLIQYLADNYAGN